MMSREKHKKSQNYSLVLFLSSCEQRSTLSWLFVFFVATKSALQRQP
jgi:hypothetical protein